MDKEILKMNDNDKEKEKEKEDEVKVYNLNIDLIDQKGDLNKAIDHMNANKIYDYSKLDHNNINLCDDCYSPIPDKTNIPYFSYCTDTKNFSIFGTGVYLYFSFIKYQILVLLLLSIVVSIPQITFSREYSIEISRYCMNQLNTSSSLKKCPDDYLGSNQNRTNITKNYYLNNMTYMNYDVYFNMSSQIALDNQIQIPKVFNMTIIHLITQFTLVIINMIVILVVYNIHLEADLLNITPEDFTLLISNLPLEENLLYKSLEHFNVPIHEVNRAYKIKDYCDIKQKYIQYKKKYNYIMNKKISHFGNFRKESKKEILSEIDRLNNLLIKYKNIDKVNNLSYNTDTAFVIFPNTSDYSKFESQFPNSTLKYLLYLIIYALYSSILRPVVSIEKLNYYKKKISLHVEKAPEPTDIIWENLEFTFFNRFKRKILIYLVALCLLIISFISLLFISRAQGSVTSEYIVIKYLISFSFSISIAIINILLNVIMELLTKFEKNRSYTEFYLSYSIKLTIFWFINQAILPVIITAFEDWNYKEILIQNSFIFFLTNAFITPLTTIFDFSHYYKKYKRYSLINKFKFNSDDIQYTQGELNQIFENTDINIAYKYAYISKTILMTIFYIPILPCGIFISLTGMGLLYLIEKYKITNHYKKPPTISSEICFTYLDSFKIIVFIYSVSVYIFHNESPYSNYFNFSLFSIIFFGILLIIPYSNYMKIDLIKVNSIDNYEEEYFNFATNYEIQNPLTKRGCLYKILSRLKTRNVISEEEYNDYNCRLNNGEIIDLLEVYKDKTSSDSNVFNNEFDIKKLIKVKKSKEKAGLLKKNKKINEKSQFNNGKNENLVINDNKDIKNESKKEHVKNLLFRN